MADALPPGQLRDEIDRNLRNWEEIVKTRLRELEIEWFGSGLDVEKRGISGLIHGAGE